MMFTNITRIGIASAATAAAAEPQAWGINLGQNDKTRTINEKDENIEYGYH